MNQKEYLRKYLSAEEDGIKKKKKKKKPNVGTKTVRIIDDDLDVLNMRPIEDGEFEIFNTTEDAPQIVGIIDERGPVDFADKRRWRIIADDGEGNVACSTNENKERDIEHTVDVEKSDRNQNEMPKKSKKLKQKKAPTGEHLDSLRKSTNGNERKVSNNSVDSDVSPPRKPRDGSDSDLSPPRASKPEKHNHKSREATKSKSKKSSKKRRKDTSTESSSSSSDSSDSSPRGKSKRRNNVKSRSKSDSDLSPPRDSKRSRFSKKSQDDADSDLSPPRRSRNNEKSFHAEQNLSTSPTRSSRKSRNYDDDSRNRKNKSRIRKDSDSDLSPPRRSKNVHRVVKSGQNKSRSPVTISRKPRGSDSDLSPPRARSKKSADPIRDSRRRDDPRNDERRRGPRECENSRLETAERRRRGSPRRSRWNDDQSRRSRSSERPSKDDDTRMTKTLDGKTAGLQDARNLRIETAAHKKREAEMFKNMSAEVSGVGQMPVLRDRRTGRKRDLNAEAAERREKEKRQEEIDEKYAKWGKGLKQVDDHAEKVQRDLYEMSKPLARYADDADLDKALREVMHVGDPMLDYIKNKQIKEGKREPERPSYQGSYMPNRFGIKPGHRWDGVDRSNGYEKKWFDARNARTALQEEAYKWSTADM